MGKVIMFFTMVYTVLMAGVIVVFIESNATIKTQKQELELKSDTIKALRPYFKLAFEQQEQLEKCNNNSKHPYYFVID